MRHRTAIAVFCFALPLAACATPPNIHVASGYSAPPAPPVKHAYYDPYIPYGEANAVWTPPSWIVMERSNLHPIHPRSRIEPTTNTLHGRPEHRADRDSRLPAPSNRARLPAKKCASR